MSDKGIVVKYEALSAEIQKEISDFHLTQAGRFANLDEASKGWFESQFESWMFTRFGKQDNSRKHFRLDIELPVRIAEILIESEEDGEPEPAHGGTTINISRGGLFFVSKRPIDSSSILKVVVDMSSIDPEFPNIEAMAMVVRCSQLETGGYGIGLMFSTIYQEDRETLNLFIFKNLSYFLTQS